MLLPECAFISNNTVFSSDCIASFLNFTFLLPCIPHRSGHFLPDAVGFLLFRGALQGGV